MNSLPTEQIIKTKAPTSSIIFKTVMIIACILAVTTIPSTYALGILLLAVLVVATVIVFVKVNEKKMWSVQYFKSNFNSTSRFTRRIENGA